MRGMLTHEWYLTENHFVEPAFPEAYERSAFLVAED